MVSNKKNKKKKLNIVFIFGGDFPIGGAYTNRMHAFAKGLIENGHWVRFLVIYPGRNLLGKNKLKGIYDKVEFKYTCKYKQKPYTKLKQIWGIITGTLGSVKEILRIQKHRRIDAIIFGTNDIFRVFPIFILSKIFRFKIIREINEYPYSELGIRKKIPLVTEFIYKVEFNLFDGIVVISRSLKKFFSNILSIRKKVLLIPIIVDPMRFVDRRKKTNKMKAIVFVGDILGEKDGVDILIQAFKIIHTNIPEFKLILIGDISDTTAFHRFKERNLDDTLEKKVIFTGFIHREKISDFINKATILVLARPANKQAEGGLPTKLGEYLATGNPVVCTKVGDIPFYLHDGYNAYLAEPNNPSDFAQKMLFAIEHPELSSRIGQRGRELVFKEFNYKIQSEAIARFILDLSKR